MGLHAAMTAAVSTSATMSVKLSMVESRRFIPSRFPAPKYRPMMAAPPFAMAVTTTSTTVVTWPPMPTALIPGAPVTCPSMTMSARLYTA